MADLNVLTMVGRLTRDAETKITSKGTTMVKFAVANSTGWGDNEVTSFFDCTYFGKGADAVKGYLVKGKRVAVTGSVAINTVEDKRYVNVTVSSVQLLDGGQPKDAVKCEDKGYSF